MLFDPPNLLLSCYFFPVRWPAGVAFEHSAAFIRERPSSLTLTENFCASNSSCEVAAELRSSFCGGFQRFTIAESALVAPRLELKFWVSSSNVNAEFSMASSIHRNVDLPGCAKSSENVAPTPEIIRSSLSLSLWPRPRLRLRVGSQSGKTFLLRRFDSVLES